ncbi:transcriptional regulator NrdR [Candidatus Beckwithbacteria bacterium CG10_big_fil_rev_8_21_14_0_10_34_10]|uniref:Transcriptional repressor NrdR n=1 Tax=Candidatus Beckwithbacteria bacterium CG10_big_fil_rev_8_21_14_0_10_34_10 TaxID=1974495 RepID=A0A2H0W8D1_9BACT|nr:MAG: transcriptional regulator NrdR [Candidatus Beckwithbacteria bacterium CG10_big_fil_rev_8_21_14_0_10_34_10]
MLCPYCSSQETSVLESRDSEDGTVVRRRRECNKCRKRFTTYERVEIIDLKVVKKEGHVEDFDREKIRQGIIKACEKRPCDEEEIESIIDDIEMRLLNRKSTEISSSDIGRLVLTRLKKLDQVAYLRFASVFLEFDDVKEFKKIIREIG